MGNETVESETTSRGHRPGGDLGAAGQRCEVTFRRGQLEGVPGAGDLAAAARSLGGALARTAASTAPRMPARARSRAERGMCNLGVRALRLGLGPPPPGHTPAAGRAAPTPPAGRPGRASLTCTATGSRRRALGPCLGGSAPERQEEESDGRRRSLGGRRRRTRDARLSGDTPSSWPLCSSRRRSLPERCERGGAGWGATSCPRRRGGRRGPGLENNGREGAGSRRLPSACRGRAALPCGWPHPWPSAPGEVKSPPGGSGVAAGFAEDPGSRRRRRDVLVSLLGTGRGFLGEEGEGGGRHLASRGQPLVPGVLGWRPLRPVAGVLQSGAGDVADRGPNPRRWQLCET
nr:collagen alpha-2(I) chain-like [Equus caballus]